MRNLTKKMTALGISVFLCLPLMAAAAAPISADAGYEGKAIAATLSDNIGKEFKTVGTTSGLNEGSRDLPSIVGGIINAFLALLGVVLVVIIIFAGYKWMTAQGNSGQVDEAKKMITQAVIGMIILMAAYAITRFVLEAVISGTTGTTTTIQ
jgi:uncharacterized membrane protein YjgN (DUF898 family)